MTAKKEAPRHASDGAEIVKPNDSEIRHNSDSVNPEFPKVEGFPPEGFFLPGPLECVVNDAARTFGLERDLCIITALGVVSAALMDRLQLKDEDGELTPANLYILASANSGTGKSKLYRQCCAVLHGIESEALEAFNRNQLPLLQAEVEVLNLELKQIRACKKMERADRLSGIRKIKDRLKEIETELIPPRLLAEDATVQKIGMLLQRDEKLSIFSSDARDVLLNITGRNNEGKTDEGIYLKGFPVEPCTIDRVGRESVVLSAPCLSMLLLVTPDAVAELVTNPRLMQGGFLARCLVVNSKSRPQLKDAGRSGPDPQTWCAWEALIRGLVATYRRAVSPAVIEATSEASELFREYWNDFADDARGQNSFSARNAELAKRIALCLHAAEHGKKACRHKLTGQTAREAILIVDEWLAPERSKLIRASYAERDSKLAARVEAVLAVHNGEVPVRDLQSRYGFRGNRMRELEDFVDRSEDFKIITRPTATKPARYLVYGSNC